MFAYGEKTIFSVQCLPLFSQHMCRERVEKNHVAQHIKCKYIVQSKNQHVPPLFLYEISRCIWTQTHKPRYARSHTYLLNTYVRV